MSSAGQGQALGTAGEPLQLIVEGQQQQGGKPLLQGELLQAFPFRQAQHL
jgi:hypothetical protein